MQVSRILIHCISFLIVRTLETHPFTGIAHSVCAEAGMILSGMIPQGDDAKSEVIRSVPEIAVPIRNFFSSCVVAAPSLSDLEGDVSDRVDTISDTLPHRKEYLYNLI